MYRESARLGRLESQHRITGGGAASWFGAGVIGILFALGFAYGAWALESARMGIGVLAMGALGVYSFIEWRRIGAMQIAIHELGLEYRSQESRLALRWEEIAALEGRYVLGWDRRGVENERNRFAIVLTAPSGETVDIPREISGFRELCEIIQRNTTCVRTQTVVRNISRR